MMGEYGESWSENGNRYDHIYCVYVGIKISNIKKNLNIF